MLDHNEYRDIFCSLVPMNKTLNQPNYTRMVNVFQEKRNCWIRKSHEHKPATLIQAVVKKGRSIDPLLTDHSDVLLVCKL